MDDCSRAGVRRLWWRGVGPAQTRQAPVAKRPCSAGPTRIPPDGYPEACPTPAHQCRLSGTRVRGAGAGARRTRPDCSHRKPTQRPAGARPAWASLHDPVSSSPAARRRPPGGRDKGEGGVGGLGAGPAEDWDGPSARRLTATCVLSRNVKYRGPANTYQSLEQGARPTRTYGPTQRCW
jgi:hypothetical protein